MSWMHNLVESEYDMWYRKSNELYEVKATISPDTQVAYSLLLCEDIELTNDGLSLFIDELVKDLNLPSIIIGVGRRQKKTPYGSLKGEVKLLTRREESFKVRYIQIYNKTAVRRKDVSRETIIKTLIHEVMHVWDMENGIPSTPHTRGFYFRVANLIRALQGQKAEMPDMNKMAQHKFNRMVW